MSSDEIKHTEEDFSSLLLKNQLCFPLYACSKEIVKRYKPFLDKIDLTYTQYITMMVLWEVKTISVKELGEKLYLDSGTLTPLLKILEKKQYVNRERSLEDERVVNVSVTKKGLSLREKALCIPEQMAGCVKISKEEAKSLYTILYKILN
ncbi:MAG: MarR family transcriptional regulator [Spirochaetales bacterium]|nr:MarR family transcriptional regulator [Spirochaetales bacterium]